MVEHIVPAGQLPDPKLYKDYTRRPNTKPRDEVSYLIRVRPGLCGVYWPKAYCLCRTHTEAALVDARRKARRICTHELVVPDPHYKEISYYCNLPYLHEGKHQSVHKEYVVMEWDR